MKAMIENRKLYACSACGGRCVMETGNGFAPLTCPYRFCVEAHWKETGNEFDKDDEWRHSFADDDEYVAGLTEEEKNEIVKNHFDCRMKGGCPCLADKEYFCNEYMAYCKLTGSDGSDFDYDDCWFRCNEHRCLTDYVLWKHRNHT